jgi:hypothetical protein
VPAGVAVYLLRPAALLDASISASVAAFLAAFVVWVIRGR